MSFLNFFQLVSLGKDRINSCDDKGWTALHHASSKGCLGDVRSLLQAGADTKITNLKGETPLMLAGKQEHMDIIELLIQCGAGPTVDGDESSWTILHHASYAGWPGIVRSIVNNERSNIDSKTSTGKTALMMAAGNSHKCVAEWLIHRGADVNCIDNNGSTALHYASSKGAKEIVWCLLHSEADPLIKNFKGETPETLANEQANAIIVKLLADYRTHRFYFIDEKRSQTMLHNASSAGKTGEVQSLLDEGADIDSKTCFGNTALMMAARNSHTDVAELLINSGADIMCCSENGLTALHYAAEAGCLEIAQYLVNKGADLDSRSRNGKTPLIRAVKQSHINMVEFLINLGANIKICCDRGWTLLHYAASRKKVEMVQFLVNKGVDLDSRSHDGRTPLIIAARSSNLNVVELFMKMGADIGNSSQCTLLHYASHNGWMEIVRSLVTNGIDLNATTSDGTPLIYALKKRKFEIADYLVKAGADCNAKDEDGRTAFNLFLVRSCEECHLARIRMFIENGAYVNSWANEGLLSKLKIQIFLLKDVKLCSQVIINNFNNKDLPELYKVLASANILPSIDKLKIKKGGKIAQQVEQDVTRDIKVRGYCNVLKVCPLVLSILSLQSFLNYIHTITNRV